MEGDFCTQQRIELVEPEESQHEDSMINVLFSLM